MLAYVARATRATNGNARDRVRCSCGFEFVVRAIWWKRGRVTKCYRCEKREASANELATS